MNLIEAFKRLMSLQRSSHVFTANELVTLMAVVNEFNDQHWPSKIKGNINIIAKSAGVNRVAASSIDKFRQLKLVSSDVDNEVILLSGLTNGAVPVGEIINNDNNVNYPTSGAIEESLAALTENDLRSQYGDKLVDTAIGIAKKRHKPAKPSYLNGILKRMTKGSKENVLPKQPKSDDFAREQSHNGERNHSAEIDQDVHSGRYSERTAAGDGRQDDDSVGDLLQITTEVAKYFEK